MIETILEIAIAVRLEAAFEKDDILQAYINQINWGRQIKGVGEASRIYFEKHPSELTLSQSALLAGIVRGPDSFNPFKSMEAATRERNTTLERMVDAKAISRAEADAAKQEPIAVRPENLCFNRDGGQLFVTGAGRDAVVIDRKSTRLNSSHRT